MGLVNDYGRVLPSGLVDNKVSSVKLPGCFWVLLVKGYIFGVNWKLASKQNSRFCLRRGMGSVQSVLHGRVLSLLSWMSGSVWIWWAPYPASDARTGTVDSQASAGHAFFICKCQSVFRIVVFICSCHQFVEGACCNLVGQSGLGDILCSQEGLGCTKMRPPPQLQQWHVHPLSSSRVSNDFSATISIWSSPNIITNLSSPYSGHSNQICIGRAYTVANQQLWLGSEMDWVHKFKWLAPPLCCCIWDTKYDDESSLVDTESHAGFYSSNCQQCALVVLTITPLTAHYNNQIRFVDHALQKLELDLLLHTQETLCATLT